MSETTPGPFAMVPSTSHPMFLEDPTNALSAWTDLCSQQASRPCKRWIAKATVSLEVHELVASLRFLAKRWRWSPSKVRRFLKLLESEKLLTTVRLGSWDRQTSVYRIEFPGYVGVSESGEWNSEVEQPRTVANQVPDVRDVREKKAIEDRGSVSAHGRDGSRLKPMSSRRSGSTCTRAGMGARRRRTGGGGWRQRSACRSTRTSSRRGFAPSTTAPTPPTTLRRSTASRRS